MDNSNTAKLVNYATALCPADFDDLTHEEATARYENAEALRRVMNEWFDGYREAMSEYVKRQPGECVPVATMEGTRYYVVSKTKTKKLKADRTLELVGRCFGDLTVEEFCDCLSSNAFKPAALMAKLDGAGEFFEVIESEKPALRKTMPPAFKKQLQAADRAIVAEGGEG